MRVASVCILESSSRFMAGPSSSSSALGGGTRRQGTWALDEALDLGPQARLCFFLMLQALSDEDVDLDDLFWGHELSM